MKHMTLSPTPPKVRAVMPAAERLNAKGKSLFRDGARPVDRAAVGQYPKKAGSLRPLLFQAEKSPLRIAFGNEKPSPGTGMTPFRLFALV